MTAILIVFFSSIAGIILLLVSKHFELRGKKFSFYPRFVARNDTKIRKIIVFVFNVVLWFVVHKTKQLHHKIVMWIQRRIHRYTEKRPLEKNNNESPFMHTMKH